MNLCKIPSLLKSLFDKMSKSATMLCRVEVPRYFNYSIKHKYPLLAYSKQERKDISHREEDRKLNSKRKVQIKNFWDDIVGRWLFLIDILVHGFFNKGHQQLLMLLELIVWTKSLSHHCN